MHSLRIRDFSEFEFHPRRDFSFSRLPRWRWRGNNWRLKYTSGVIFGKPRRTTRDRCFRKQKRGKKVWKKHESIMKRRKKRLWKNKLCVSAGITFVLYPEIRLSLLHLRWNVIKRLCSKIYWNVMVIFVIFFCMQHFLKKESLKRDRKHFGNPTSLKFDFLNFSLTGSKFSRYILNLHAWIVPVYFMVLLRSK